MQTGQVKYRHSKAELDREFRKDYDPWRFVASSATRASAFDVKIGEPGGVTSEALIV